MGATIENLAARSMVIRRCPRCQGRLIVERCIEPEFRGNLLKCLNCGHIADYLQAR